MTRVVKHLRIGRRWLINGWLLFQRNPWLLTGMGITATVLLGTLVWIPLIGGLLIALVAPVMLASGYLSLDHLYRQNVTLPADLRVPALKQAPREFLRVFKNEDQMMSTLAASMLSVSVVLLMNLLVRLLVGETWVAHWGSLDFLTLSGMVIIELTIFLIYLLLAASLIYAVPLALLREQPLLPSLRSSLKASRHFLVALLVLLGLSLLPFLIAALLSLLSLWISLLVWIVTASLILPLVSASLYCSYTDIFTTRDAWLPIDRRRHTSELEPGKRSPRSP